MVIAFEVIGKAKPAGSKKGFPMKNGRIAIVDTSGSEGRIWRHIVQDRAKEAMAEFGGDLLTCPVSIYVKFIMARPRYHYGKGKNEGLLLPKYRFAKHVSKPDSTKLLRAIEDALTGIAWKDDSQVYRQLVIKEYGDIDKVVVRIFPHLHESEEDGNTKSKSAG